MWLHLPAVTDLACHASHKVPLALEAQPFRSMGGVVHRTFSTPAP